jgi:hypothetical protein
MVSFISLSVDYSVMVVAIGWIEHPELLLLLMRDACYKNYVSSTIIFFVKI